MPVVEINGTAIHYHVQGEGPTLICVHPPVITRANFNYQSAELSNDFRVITFDIRGHGHSEFSPVPITYSLIVEDMKQLLDYLDIDRAYVVGYSTGGTIALEALLTHPARFCSAIVVSGMPLLSDLWNRSNVRMALGALTARGKNTVARAIAWGNADSRTTYHKLYTDAKHGNALNWRQYFECSLNYNCTDKLRMIQSPVLLLYGKSDRTFYRYARNLERDLPNAELRWIEKKPHQLPTKASREINSEIARFVKRTEQDLEQEREQDRDRDRRNTDLTRPWEAAEFFVEQSEKQSDFVVE